MTSKKILVLITANPDKESLCYANAKVIEKAAKKQGYEVIRHEAFDYPLINSHPVKNKGFRKEFDVPSDDFTKADSFVVVTPMWNFSLPGALKNFLDGSVQARKSFRFKSLFGRFGVPVGLLKAKKVTCVWTSDGPSLGFKVVFPWNGVKHQIKSIFWMCGVNNYKQLVLDEVFWKSSQQDRKEKVMKAWFRKLEKNKW